MKVILFIFVLFLMLNSCVSRKTVEKISTVLDKEESLYAELKKENVDTILVLKKRCSGCIPGYNEMVEVVYVFWKNDGVFFITKIDNSLIVYNTVHGGYDNFTYLFSNLEQIKSENLESNEPLMSYHSTKIIVRYNGSYFEKDITDNQCVINKGKAIVTFKMMIESLLFNLERRKSFTLKLSSP